MEEKTLGPISPDAEPCWEGKGRKGMKWRRHWPPGGVGGALCARGAIGADSPA